MDINICGRNYSCTGQCRKWCNIILYEVVELPHSLQDRIATCITLTLTLTVKLTRTLNLTLQLTLTLTHLDPNCSLTMHNSNNNNFPREAER